MSVKVLPPLPSRQLDEHPKRKRPRAACTHVTICVPCWVAVPLSCLDKVEQKLHVRGRGDHLSIVWICGLDPPFEICIASVPAQESSTRLNEIVSIKLSHLF